MSVHAIKAPAGLGKTTLIIDKIKATKHKLVEIYVPTLALAREIEKKILANGITVKVMLGREQEISGGKTMCEKPEIANTVAKLGYPVFSVICMGEKTPGDRHSRGVCEHFAKCEYLQQFETRARVCIYTHAYLPIPRSSKLRRRPSLVIIDESFLSTCLATYEIPRAQLLDLTRDHPAARSVVKFILAAIDDRKPLLDELRVAEITAERLAKTHEEIRQTGAYFNPHRTDAEFLTELRNYWVPRVRVDIMMEIITAELAAGRADSQGITFDHGRQVLTLHYRKPIIHFISGRREPDIILIDANADPELIRPWFPDVKFSEIPAKRNAYVVQCSSTRGATSSFVPARNDNAETKARVEEKLDGIRGLIQEESANGSKKVLVVGPQAVTGNPNKEINPLIPCPTNGVLAHFGALRGVDEYKDFDSEILIGRNQPPIEALECLARSLWYDAKQPLTFADDWILQERPYRLRDPAKTIGIEVQVHPDPRIQRLHEQLREGESTQAIDRLRLIHSKEKKRVIVLSNIPLDLEVDELVDLNTLLWMSRFDRAWQTLDGVMPLNPEWLAKYFPDLWPTTNAARMDLRAAVKKGQIVNSIYINNSTLLNFHYRVNGQKRHSRAISLRSVHETQAKLVRLLDVPIMIRDVSGPTPGPECNVAIGRAQLQPLMAAAAGAQHLSMAADCPVG